jgi:hypothetical protein
MVQTGEATRSAGSSANSRLPIRAGRRRALGLGEPGNKRAIVHPAASRNPRVHRGKDLSPTRRPRSGLTRGLRRRRPSGRQRGEVTRRHPAPFGDPNRGSSSCSRTPRGRNRSGISPGCLRCLTCRTGSGTQSPSRPATSGFSTRTPTSTGPARLPTSRLFLRAARPTSISPPSQHYEWRDPVRAVGSNSDADADNPCSCSPKRCERLGLTRQGLQFKLKQLGLTREGRRRRPEE